MHILSVSEMRALESTADMAGHTYAQMMEMAGQSVALAIHQRVAVKGRQVLVLVGPGNNGGDGLVAARFLQNAGANVTAYLTRSRAVKEDVVYRQAEEHHVTFINAENDAGRETLRRLTRTCHILIDALLGTGATLPLRGAVADVLRVVNNSLADQPHLQLTRLNTPPDLAAPRPFIVAVDGPSGMEFDTGEVDTVSLNVHLSVTFAVPKWGHFRFPAAAYSGELLVADIGIPAGIVVPGDREQVTTPQTIQQWLPSRPIYAHKGTFGKALIVAGSVNYTGAATLAATAAVRAGVGLVIVGIPNLLHVAIASALPEATYILLPHTRGVLDAPAASVLREYLADYSALLLGPGVGNTPETLAFVRTLLGLAPKKRNAGFLLHQQNGDEEPVRPLQLLPPLVVDADGLNLLSQIEGWSTLLSPNTILTPHPGEMARLTGKSVADVQADRINIARKSAQVWGHIVVLKGAFTVIAAPDGQIMLLPFANPALSSAGTGDVLAGTIVALLAQGLAPFPAAVTGAYLHGLAGEIVRQRLGETGVAASDVATALPEARRRLK